jgi:hypothetical protein
MAIYALCYLRRQHAHIQSLPPREVDPKKSYVLARFTTHGIYHHVPSGKHTRKCGKSPFSMGKLTSSMAIFNSYVKLPEGIDICLWGFPKTWIFRFFSKTNPSTNRLGDSQGSWTFLLAGIFLLQTAARHYVPPETFW